jgi:hypothetical protein
LVVCAQGHGRKGTHALQLALEKLNNVEHDHSAPKSGLPKAL